MGIRFHKSIKIVKGLRINLSKTGISLSAGGAPFTVNAGRKGTKVTVSAPGTGLSWFEFFRKKR